MSAQRWRNPPSTCSTSTSGSRSDARKAGQFRSRSRGTDLCAKPLALKPYDGWAYYGLALTYAEKGVYEEALRASQKAVELLDPADDDALLGPAYV